jgi:uncharacterized membrane protein
MPMMLALPFVLGTALLAVMVHLASLLALPVFATNDAYARLGRDAPLDQVTALTQAQVAALGLPFYDRSFETAVCKYDLSAGVLRLRAPSPDTMLLVTLIAQGGNVYFSVTDRAAIKGLVEVLIGTQAQIEQIEASDRDDEVLGELRVRAPKPRGLALIRVFAPDETSKARAAEDAAQASCQIETL